LPEIAEEYAWSEPFCRQIGFEEGVLNAEVARRMVQNLRGETSSPGSFGEEGFDEAAFVRRMEQSSLKFALHFYVLVKMRVLLMTGDHEGALLMAERSEPLLPVSLGLLQVPEHHFLSALALAAAARARGGDDRPLRKRIDAHIDALAGWAEGCPQNFLH